MSDFREPTTLGRTGLRVSRLGVGSSYGVPAGAIERAYHEYGVNYFYWGSLRRKGMGEAIRHLTPAHRDKLVIALQSYDRTGLRMPRLTERSLRALGLDCADVLILGWMRKAPRGRMLDAALKLRDEGKVRFLAMSSHKRPLFAEAVGQPESPIDIYMIRYNAAHRGAEQDVFPHLPVENRPGTTIYTATRWGTLLKQSRMPPGERPLTATECYRFALTNARVDLCITGPKNADEMDQALRTLDSPPLSEEELERCRRIGDHVHG